MDYRNASDEQLVRTIGGGAMPGAMAFGVFQGSCRLSC